MSTLLLNHAAVNDLNSSQCISSLSGSSGSEGLGGCLGGVGVGGVGVGGVRTWHNETDSYLTSYDASSAAVVAAARFMQGYRHHHHYQQQHHHQQPSAMLPAISSTFASAGNTISMFGDVDFRLSCYSVGLYTRSGCRISPSVRPSVRHTLVDIAALVIKLFSLTHRSIFTAAAVSSNRACTTSGQNGRRP